MLSLDENVKTNTKFIYGWINALEKLKFAHFLKLKMMNMTKNRNIFKKDGG